MKINKLWFYKLKNLFDYLSCLNRFKNEIPNFICFLLFPFAWNRQKEEIKYFKNLII